MNTKTKTTKDFDKKMGARIAEMRHSRGYTQQQVADAIDLSRVQVTYIENGTCSTSQFNIFKMSVLFKCTVADLFPTNRSIKIKIQKPC